jgi:nucleoside-diphosphate-sugar epimerase
LFKFSKRIGVNFFIAVGSGDEHKKKSSNIYIHEKQRVFNHLSSNSNESDYCWLRPFQIYGKRGCSGILDQLVDARLKGNQIILENSDDVFHWTSSNDVARAVLAALKGRIPGAHDIAHKDANSVLNFALIFSDLLQLDSEYIRKSQLISINSEYIKPNFTSKLHTAWEARDSIFSGLQRYVS